ncbi:uncharacterized protein FMAN_12338 [Fusarium mangiferae]|uniref:Uncharacterized protein n=1 Tax=Fusarium mangiferae TaxID=192010 RepID=A0A1L7TSP1_FUSMA|nr:uncharacterized protein FMAN_12338 [Fusarium mangiferae]CVK98327.1 uncharacterized protein FMAN_12338 [Fusarium mangiferae]
MNAADQAHLAAMGLATPLPTPTPVSRRQEIRDRAAALRPHIMGRSNEEALRYRQRVSALANGHNPVWAFRLHLQWLPGFLASGNIPLQERKIVADIAEETAHFAIEQAEKHNRLLRKWVWGYNTLADRRRHERFAHSAHRAAIKWVEIADKWSPSL